MCQSCQCLAYALHANLAYLVAKQAVIKHHSKSFFLFAVTGQAALCLHDLAYEVDIRQTVDVHQIANSLCKTFRVLVLDIHT